MSVLQGEGEMWKVGDLWLVASEVKSESYGIDGGLGGWGDAPGMEESPRPCTLLAAGGPGQQVQGGEAAGQAGCRTQSLALH